MNERIRQFPISEGEGGDGFRVPENEQQKAHDPGSEALPEHVDTTKDRRRARRSLFLRRLMMIFNSAVSVVGPMTIHDNTKSILRDRRFDKEVAESDALMQELGSLIGGPRAGALQEKFILARARKKEEEGKEEFSFTGVAVDVVRKIGRRNNGAPGGAVPSADIQAQTEEKDSSGKFELNTEYVKRFSNEVLPRGWVNDEVRAITYQDANPPVPVNQGNDTTRWRVV